MNAETSVAAGRKKGSLRIHQAIAQKLGTEILSGLHPPGGGFPGEIEKAAELGVSRTAYREAMRILTAKGLLESRPKSGTRVTGRDRWNVLDPDILAWMFMGKPDEGFIRDLFELRAILEPEAARLAALRRSPEQLTGMQGALEAMRHHGLKSAAGQAADQQFHRLILDATGNTALASLASSVGAAVEWTTRFKQRATPNPRDPLPEHERVLERITTSDGPGASDAMTRLVLLALEDMGEALSGLASTAAW